MLLAIQDLTKEFVRRGTPFAAVDHVTLHLDAGRFVAIVGRSGNGKSTLLNMVCGLLRPTSGTVTIDGRTVSELDDRELSLLRNRTVGFVTQSQTLLSNLTVLDNVLLPAVMFPGTPLEVKPAGAEAPEPSSSETPSKPAADQDGAMPASDPDMPDVIAPMEVQAPPERDPDDLERRAMSLLEALDVADLAESYPKELSGGEMRRVSIARALMNGPKLLVADEPTGDLDAESTVIVMELLRSLAQQGTAVLMVTHDADALPYAERIYTMDAGKLTSDER